LTKNNTFTTENKTIEVSVDKDTSDNEMFSLFKQFEFASNGEYTTAKGTVKVSERSIPETTTRANPKSRKIESSGSGDSTEGEWEAN
jgi:hypothetical protein